MNNTKTKKTPWFETLHVDLDTLNAFEAKRGFTWDEGNLTGTWRILVKNSAGETVKEFRSNTRWGSAGITKVVRNTFDKYGNALGLS